MFYKDLEINSTTRYSIEIGNYHLEIDGHIIEISKEGKKEINILTPWRTHKFEYQEHTQNLLENLGLSGLEGNITDKLKVDLKDIKNYDEIKKQLSLISTEPILACSIMSLLIANLPNTTNQFLSRPSKEIYEGLMSDYDVSSWVAGI